MTVVPLIALSQSWPVAATFIVLERIGGAIRSPARDAMMARAAARLRGGWVFGLREALDSGGAVIGPLIVTAFFSYSLSDQDRRAFEVLSLPAFLTLLSLNITCRIFPNHSDLDVTHSGTQKRHFPLAF